MAAETFHAKPTASSLQRELSDSLELLKRDLGILKYFVEEIAPAGVPASIPLSREDLHELLAAASEIHDAADDIVFEAGKIKEKLERLG